MRNRTLTNSLIVDSVQKWFPSVDLWLRTGKMQNEKLATDPQFLQSLLSYVPAQDEIAAWRVFQVFRYLIALGATVRFALAQAINRSLPIDSHAQNQFPILSFLSLSITLSFFVIVELIGASRRYESFPDANSRIRWVRRIYIAEVTAIPLLYTVTANPYSDVAYFLLLPFLFCAEFLSFRSTLRRLRILPALVLFSSLAANSVAGSHAIPLPAVILNVSVTRSLFIFLLAIMFLYTRRVAKARRAVLRAMLKAIPEGLIVVSPRSLKIAWVNDVLADVRANNAPITGQRCGEVFKTSNPNPLRQSLEGRICHAIVTGPEFCSSVEDVCNTSTGDVHRTYDAYCAPIELGRENVAALQLVRDITSREVLATVTQSLQSAAAEDTILESVARALDELGYSRSRIYLLSDDGTAFRGACSSGMGSVPFKDLIVSRFGEPHSEQTIRSEKPCVYPPIGDAVNDPYAKVLNKDPLLPWIEVPITVGGVLYGKISIDNKGHPRTSRRFLIEEVTSVTRPEQSENLVVLHNIGVQMALALQRVRAIREKANFLSTYIHFSVRQLNLLPAAAFALLQSGPEIQKRRERSYEHICGIARLLSEHGRIVQTWADSQHSHGALPPLSPALHNLREIAAEVCQWYGYNAEMQQLSLELNPNDMVASVDDTVVKHILFILIGNSVDSLHLIDPSLRRRRIIVTTNRIESDLVELCVKDNGVGLATDVQATLFQPKPYVPGSYKLGIGMVIARSLALAHGGSLSFQNNIPGDGVEFVCKLREQPYVK